MKQFLKSAFDLFVRTRWLKLIDKETRKYHRLNDKAKRQAYVVNCLIEGYKKQYPGGKS